MRKFELPAKTFLLGEYLALLGGPAILYLTPPPFTISAAADKNSDNPFHLDSPAGKFLFQAKNITDISFDWINPYAARGGFGASSAEFAGLFLFENASQIGEISNSDLAWRARDAFLALHPNAKVKPSGIDVVAQVYGALSDPFSTMLLYIDANKKEIASLPKPSGQKVRLELLHTGNKLATHEHLASLQAKIPQKEAESIVLEAKEFLEKGDSTGFLGPVEDYQALLQATGLTSSHTLKILKDLEENEHVLTAKGCGALGSDVIACFQSPQAPHMKQAIFSELW